MVANRFVHPCLGPYFCLIADIQGIIYFTITFPPPIILQNKIYCKTINYTSFPLCLIWFAAQSSVHSPESYCSLRGFAAQSPSVWWWMHCEPTETAVRLHGDCAANWKNFELVEKIFIDGDSTANALRLTANALRMRCECAANARRLWKLKNVQFAVESQSNSPKCESSIMLLLFYWFSSLLSFWRGWPGWKKIQKDFCSWNYGKLRKVSGKDIL